MELSVTPQKKWSDIFGGVSEPGVLDFHYLAYPRCSINLVSTAIEKDREREGKTEKEGMRVGEIKDAVGEVDHQWGRFSKNGTRYWTWYNCALEDGTEVLLLPYSLHSLPPPPPISFLPLHFPRSPSLPSSPQ